MLGDHFAVNSLSPDLRTLYGQWSGTDTTDAGVGTGSFVTLGGASIAKELRVDGTATSYTVLADNALYTAGGLGVTNGIFATKGTSALAAGQFTDGAIGTSISGGGFGLTTNGRLNVNGNNIEITTSGVYKHLGVDGVTVASRASGGIDIGSTHEIEFQFLLPTDKILVRR